MVTHQLQVRCRPVKVRRSETDVLPLSQPYIHSARNDLLCVEWDVKLYSLTIHSLAAGTGTERSIHIQSVTFFHRVKNIHSNLRQQQRFPEYHAIHISGYYAVLMCYHCYVICLNNWHCLVCKDFYTGKAPPRLIPLRRKTPLPASHPVRSVSLLQASLYVLCIRCNESSLYHYILSFLSLLF